MGNGLQALMQLSETSQLTLLTYGSIRSSSIASESKLGRMMTLAHQCVQSCCLPCQPGDLTSVEVTSLFKYFYRVQRHVFLVLIFAFCLYPAAPHPLPLAIGSISGLGMPVILQK